MKAPVFFALLSLAVAGCQSVPASVEQIVITTPTGRKERLKRQYTIREMEAGSTASKPTGNKFDISHPVYPQKEEIEELKVQLRVGDQVWYFQGLDSGWAIVRDGHAVWMLVTNHEY